MCQMMAFRFQAIAPKKHPPKNTTHPPPLPHNLVTRYFVQRTISLWLKLLANTLEPKNHPLPVYPELTEGLRATS